jgi:hypothetical protein
MMVSDHFIRSPTLRSLARFTSLSIFLDSVMEAIAKLPLKSRRCKVVVFFITLSIGTPVVVLAWLGPAGFSVLLLLLLVDVIVLEVVATRSVDVAPLLNTLGRLYGLLNF